MSEIKQRRVYTSDFKRDAVALSREPGRKVKDVAAQLGISEKILNRWRSEQKALGKIAFPGNGKAALTEDQKRIRELEKQLRDSEIEREILKKAVGIFSKVSR